MLKLNIKTKAEILKEGIEFSGDVCFSGEYGQQVYDKEMEDGGHPIQQPHWNFRLFGFRGLKNMQQM